MRGLGGGLGGDIDQVRLIGSERWHFAGLGRSEGVSRQLAGAPVPVCGVARLLWQRPWPIEWRLRVGGGDAVFA